MHLHKQHIHGPFWIKLWLVGPLVVANKAVFSRPPSLGETLFQAILVELSGFLFPGLGRVPYIRVCLCCLNKRSQCSPLLAPGIPRDQGQTPPSLG